MGHGGLDEVVRLVDHVERLEQVDDVDAVALGEDELLHLRVPTTGLVAEVQASLQHIAHSDLSHGWLWTPATASVAGWHTSFENSTEPVLKKTGSPL